MKKTLLLLLLCSIPMLTFAKSYKQTVILTVTCYKQPAAVATPCFSTGYMTTDPGEYWAKAEKEGVEKTTYTAKHNFSHGAKWIKLLRAPTQQQTTSHGLSHVIEPTYEGKCDTYFHQRKYLRTKDVTGTFELSATQTSTVKNGIVYTTYKDCTLTTNNWIECPGGKCPPQ